jgi:hypothetical protein
MAVRFVLARPRIVKKLLPEIRKNPCKTRTHAHGPTLAPLGCLGNDDSIPDTEEVSAMKNSTKIAVSILSLAVLPFIGGCGSSTEQVKETSVETKYVPAPPPQVVVQPAPVVALPPTTVTTTEEKSASNSTDTGNNATDESSSSYHSESSTVTPMAAVPAAPPQTETTTTYQKKTYQETN